LDKTGQLLQEGVNYFQLVYTLPDSFSALILGNRRELYDLLFRSAWQALDEVLQETGKFQPAALMVLHTWNQELGHHPHVHAVVPGGGPSQDGKRWVTSRHPTERNRKKPYLVDNVLLGRRFREKFAEGFRRLVLGGKLRLEGKWARLLQPKGLEAWLRKVTASDWNVFIEGPPDGKSDPADLLKYLARYLTGGPISDRRILRDEQDRVTFWARSKNKAAGNPSRPVELPGKEFVRRWSMHILPKGYTRTRCYGGYHGSKRQAYGKRCRELLPPPSSQPVASPQRSERIEPTLRVCPRCLIPMCCIVNHRRPSWWEVFDRRIYADPAIYSPVLYIFGSSSAGIPYEPDG
jgi:hypothetical protein